MPNKILTCVNCKGKTQINVLRFRKILEKFDALTMDEVNRQYLCRKCRVFATRMSKCNIDKTRMFKCAKHDIETEVKLYKKRGLDNTDARDNFMSNVKVILDKCNVTCYSYYILENELKGIKIQIPFLGDILMKIKTNK